MERKAMDRMITMVFPANVSPVWPQVAAILKPVVDRMGTHDVEDIRRAIMAGVAQLWVQWSGMVEATIVTEFKSYPKGLWLNVWLFSALKDRKPNEAEFERHIFSFMEENGCAGVQYSGRRGFKERYKHLNFKEHVVCYLKSEDIRKAA